MSYTNERRDMVEMLTRLQDAGMKMKTKIKWALLRLETKFGKLAESIF